MPRAATGFVVTGIEPTDAAWKIATPAQRAAFMQEAKRIVLRAFDRQLAAGLDKAGRPLAKLKPGTIKHRHSAMGKADPGAPPLMPARGSSRTRSLVDGRVEGNTVRVFWRRDQFGMPWGRVLSYHARGAGRLPVRDVLGLRPAAHAAVVAEARRWWAAYSGGIAIRPPLAIKPAPFAGRLFARAQ